MLLADKLYFCIFKSSFSQLRISAFILQQHSYSFHDKYYMAFSCVCQSRDAYENISSWWMYQQHRDTKRLMQNLLKSRKVSPYPTLRKLQNRSCVCLLHIASEITLKLHNNFPRSKADSSSSLCTSFPALDLIASTFVHSLNRSFGTVIPSCPCSGNAVPGTWWNAGLLEQAPSGKHVSS